eukprot:COSAG05_NODE_1240_length_5422_cov_6.791283_7_plen_81_part_00
MNMYILYMIQKNNTKSGLDGDMAIGKPKPPSHNAGEWKQKNSKCDKVSQKSAKRVQNRDKKANRERDADEDDGERNRGKN